jgi:tocopherol cyclase
MPLRNILHPNRYHGFVAHAPFFEGWYFKLVSADEAERFAIIPGVYLSEDYAERHCFIQVFDSKADQVRYHRYPFEAFKPSPDAFEIMLGPNYFSADRIELAIDDDLGKLKGVLTFQNLSPWPVKFFSPGAMGWFAWVPLMECYHGVISMDHAVQGDLMLDNQPVDFSGGRGYIEKDWGKRFPSAWIWGQSNHFNQEGVSLMISVAVIPWLGQSFAGFIIGFLFEGKIHRFATYNRSKIEEIRLDDKHVDIVVRNSKHRLKIRAIREEGGLLQAPTEIAMDRRILETLNASLEIQFETLDGELLYQSVGKHAGLEIVGDLEQLIDLVGA